MSSFLVVFPDTSIRQAFSINTFHRWVSQMGRLRPNGRNNHQEQLWEVSDPPVFFWGFSSQQPDLSRLSPHVLPEMTFPLISLTGVKNLTHRLCQLLAKKSTMDRYLLLDVYYVCRWSFHLVQFSTALIWHTSILE